MNKLVIVCPHCKQKMKLGTKIAKYRCPHCKEIYKLNLVTLISLKIKNFFKGIAETLTDGKNNLRKKYSDAKRTAEYMAQVRKNMKQDPNWSNYHREQKQQKRETKSEKLKKFFKR
ncbi:MAG: hypothetical protein ACRDB7_03730 [Fusobacteriaceae bacterium]